MTRILVPLDADGDRTMRQVEALRDLPLETDAEVLLLHVYDPIDAHGTGVAGTSIDEINAAMERLHGLPDELPEADEQLQGAGYSTRLITAVDEVDTAILSVAEAETVESVGSTVASSIGSSV